MLSIPSWDTPDAHGAAPAGPHRWLAGPQGSSPLHRADAGQLESSRGAQSLEMLQRGSESHSQHIPPFPSQIIPCSLCAETGCATCNSSMTQGHSPAGHCLAGLGASGCMDAALLSPLAGQLGRAAFCCTRRAPRSPPSHCLPRGPQCLSCRGRLPPAAVCRSPDDPPASCMGEQ